MSTRIHKPQNAALVALALQCGSMRALAEAMGVHWTALYAWARGEEIPDFARMLAKGRYGQANDCLLRMTGMTENLAKRLVDLRRVAFAPQPR